MYDERCLELARHFLPGAHPDQWAALAQAIQDAVERFDTSPAPAGNGFTAEQTS